MGSTRTPPTFLARELRLYGMAVGASYSVGSRNGLNSLGAIDGDAIWFLSAIDPTTGEFKRKTDGTPFWQRNILYYLVVPSGHSSAFGVNCNGAADSDTTSMNGEPGVEDISLAATALLGFRVQLGPDPKWPGEVRLFLKSVAVESAQREIPIGQTRLGESIHTSEVEFSVFPEAP